jgi:hypothetical protein
MSDHVDSVLEDVEGYDPDTMDNPNQQVVRPDGSGPADEGEGGSTRDDKPATPEEQEARTQAVEQAAPAGAAGLDEMTKEELLDYARSRDISPANGGMTKDELRASIDEAEG